MKQWIENRAEIEDILKEAAVGRLGIVADGEPYIVPLNFAYSDGRIFFHTGVEGRKIDAIRSNPRVCFEVDEVHEVVFNREQTCFSTAYYHSVIAWGTARFVESDAEKMKCLEIIIKKYADDKAFEIPPEHALAIVSVCEIQIDKMTAKANLPDAQE
ncbi:MAG: pyridoxamine 5'-phosphate oxidase family protein [Candidatus Lindowbacteria bacterium]|nr:pyridoxamine 5'-phosphate oxidase family protein [Candidatus Lindowbacteria bacterium]